MAAAGLSGSSKSGRGGLEDQSEAGCAVDADAAAHLVRRLSA